MLIIVKKTQLCLKDKILCDLTNVKSKHIAAEMVILWFLHG